jgi:hypothetical protein
MWKICKFNLPIAGSTRLVATLAIAAGSLAAQTFKLPAIELGLKGGVPINDTFITGSSGDFSYSSADRRYLVGPTAEFHVRGPLSFEVDALYRRLGFDNSAPDFGGVGTLRRSTVANQWDIPALLKLHMTQNRFKPFIDFGASLRHITSMRETTYTATNFAPIINDNSLVLRNRNTPGGVFGVGGSLTAGKAKLTPEIRYTRWFSPAFEDTSNRLLQSNLNQIDFLVGLNF